MFDVNQRRILNLFCEINDATQACRMVQEGFKQPAHIFVGKLSDGSRVDEWPRYDDEDFRSFLTHYRKLRSRGSDRATSLAKIIKLLKANGDPIDGPTLSHFESEIAVEEKCWWGDMSNKFLGQGSLPTLFELEELILNGDVMHADFQKRDQLLQLTGGMPLTKAVAFLNYLRLARTVVHYSLRTAELIRSREYLKEPEGSRA